MNPATQIALSTLRLECSNATQSGVGTGFLFVYKMNIERNGENINVSIPMVITNKHVVRDMDTLKTTLTLVPRNTEVDDSIFVEGESYQIVTIENLQETIILHPDPDVDIAIFSFRKFEKAIPEGMIIKTAEIKEEDLLTIEESSKIRAIEPTMMIGYPNGLWDSANNRPIARRGVSASHPLHSWNNERKFLIDAACFPGSSGSPVFLFDDGPLGTRVKLLGVLFAGPLISQEGRIEQRTIPTGTSYVAVTDFMMNLGFVAHATLLKDFIPILKDLVEQK